MTQLSIEVQSASGAALASASDQGQVGPVYEQAYAPGDSIVLTSSEEQAHLMIQLDDAMNPGLVYLNGKEYRFAIPFRREADLVFAENLFRREACAPRSAGND